MISLTQSLFILAVRLAFMYMYVNVEANRTSEIMLTTSHLFCTVLCHVQPIVPLLLHFENRNSYRYWPSIYLPKSLYNSLPTKVIYALNDLLFSYFGLLCTMFTIMAAVSYLGLAYIWLKTINENIKFGMPVKIAIQLYREQLVLNKIANAVLADSLVPTFLLGGGFVLGQILVALIKSYREQPLSVLANLVVALILIVWAVWFVIDVGGKCWETSVRIKQNLILYGPQSKKTSTIMWKTINAQLEVRIYMRSDFYFKSTTYFAFLETILTNSITVILATNV